MNAIHLIRLDRELSLKETVKLVDNLPAVIFEGLTHTEAESIVAKYAEKGLIAELFENKVATDAPVQTSFNVELSSFGSNKIAVIKVIRELNKGMRLLEARRLLDNLPAVVLKEASKDQAALAKEKLTAAGASAEIR